MKRYIKAVTLLLSLIFILSAFPAAFAVENGRLTVGEASGVAGGNVSVPISLGLNPGITAMKLNVTYDKAVLTLTSVSDAGVLGTVNHNPTLTLSPYVLSWMNPTAQTNFSSNGVIVTLNFAISESAAMGDYGITVTYDNSKDDILNKDMQTVDFTVISGKVTVLEKALPAPISDFDYILTGSDITINKYKGNATEVIIAPEYIIDNNECTVVGIGEDENDFFCMNNTVESLTLPESVTQIAGMALYGCGNLTEVTVLGNPTIGEKALGYYHPAKADITVPGFTLYGWTGDSTHISNVQAYAADNGITFAGLEKVTLRGYQTSNDIATAEFYRIRFAATIDSLNYQSIGIDVTAAPQGKCWSTGNQTTVYKSIKATQDGKTTAITAAQFEDEYIYAIAIQKIPSRTVTTFTVTPYVVNVIGARVNGSAYLFVTDINNGIISARISN